MFGKYEGPFLGNLITICHQIVEGINHLHLLKIVHGDLKPTNILISIPKGALAPLLKISDFGLSHAVPTTSIHQKTHFRLAFTEGWMCPSDALDEEERRCPSFDIFSLGLIFGNN